MIKNNLLLALFISLPITTQSTGAISIPPINRNSKTEYFIKRTIDMTFSIAAIVIASYIVKKSFFNNEIGHSTALEIDQPPTLLPTDTFDCVAGVAEAKDELQDIIDFLRNPTKYEVLGAKIPRGILLTGAPGNGKTLLARAVAGESQCSFISTTGSEFVEMYVGVGASRIRDLFAKARKNAPCIVFIDEIDAIGMSRNDNSGSLEYAQTLNQLLSEMDGFEAQNDLVIVLAATNRPDILDKALLRPGRFDRKVEVPYPDLASRKEILKLHSQNVTMDLSINMHKIACGTSGFSGAELANLVNEAALSAIKRGGKYVCTQDFEDARDKVLVGNISKTMVVTEHERETTAYHEAGHALIRLLLPEYTDPLHKITITPRGGALGITYSLPETEKHSETREHMLATIQVLLGGRIAEQLEFAEIGTGASNDFEKATKVANAMVCHYGMSSLGTIIYPSNGRYSEETAHKIDHEVRKIVDDCYKKAEQLLKNNRNKLTILAQALLKKETLDAQEVYKLLDIKSRAFHSFN